MMVDDAISSWAWGRNVFAWVAGSRQSAVSCGVSPRVCLSCISLMYLFGVVGGPVCYICLPVHSLRAPSVHKGYN
jgi:hypothetical protein